jgi:hypothetical protein
LQREADQLLVYILRTTGWAGHKEGMVVAENVIFYYCRVKNKNRWTHFVRTKATTALQSILVCNVVSPGAIPPVTQRHTDHSTTALLLTEH